jgi:hypothetical protein
MYVHRIDQEKVLDYYYLYLIDNHRSLQTIHWDISLPVIDFDVFHRFHFKKQSREFRMI